MAKKNNMSNIEYKIIEPLESTAIVPEAIISYLKVELCGTYGWKLGFWDV